MFSFFFRSLKFLFTLFLGILLGGLEIEQKTISAHVADYLGSREFRSRVRQAGDYIQMQARNYEGEGIHGLMTRLGERIDQAVR